MTWSYLNLLQHLLFFLTYRYHIFNICDIYAMMIVFYFKRKHKLIMYVYARLELESILYLRIKYFIN